VLLREKRAIIFLCSSSTAGLVTVFQKSTNSHLLADPLSLSAKSQASRNAATLIDPPALLGSLSGFIKSHNRHIAQLVSGDSRENGNETS
jgi:hypothetical protein